jgi:hypothetical protein
LDASARLETHSAVTSDEGSFRDDFSGSSLVTAIAGTLSFVSGSQVVTGSGTTFTTSVYKGQWVKKTADAETLFAQVETVGSDTSITLASPYAGTTASGVAGVVSDWNTLTATGGSISVASSVVSLASGTTSGQSSYIQRAGDYLPYSFFSYGLISQRIANQTGVIGFRDNWVTPNQRAEVQFTGTNNTQVNFVTSFSSAASDIQTTTVTLPNGGITSTNHIYKIDLSGNQASLSIDGILVASNNLHIPGPYDTLQVFLGITNTGVAASSTTVSFDSVYFYNIDRVQIDNDFQGEAMSVQGSVSSGQSISGNPVVVGGADGTNTNARTLTVAVDRAAMTAGSATGIPFIGQSSGVGRIARLSRLGYVNPGYQTLLAADSVEGSTINSWLWAQSVATMTIAQTSGLLTLNNGAITTTTTSAIITSNRQFFLLSQAPTSCSFRALVVQTTNAVQELGFGAPTGVTAIINNGAFFRVSSSGQVRGVTSFNGTENVSVVLATLVSTSYYLFIVVLEDNGARFIVEDSSGVPLIDSFLSLPLTTPDKAAVTHIPAFARVYTTGAAGVAPQTRIASFQAWQYEMNTAKPWAEQLSSAGRSANINPTTFAQTVQLAAGAAPATITPNNTGSTAYTTLGGEFVLNGTASSENLLGVFGFTVPSPYTFVITDLFMPPPVVTTALGATVNIQEWCMMVASSTNPSTATGQRYTLGLFSAAASAAIGTVYNGQTINARYQTPITVLPGQVLLVLVKLISGSAAGVYRGSIFINGYYE